MATQTWRIFCSLDQMAGLELEADAIQLLNQTFDTCPNSYGTVSMVTSAEQTPDLVALEKQTNVPEAIKSRLLMARSSLLLENPSELEDSPLQVSLLEFLLLRAHPCIIQWEDGQMEFGEEVLRNLNIFKRDPAFPQENECPRAPSPHHNEDAFGSPLDKLVHALLTGSDQGESNHSDEEAAQPSQNPFERYLDCMETAQEDFDVAMNLKQAIRHLPKNASRLLQLIAQRGMIPWEEAAKNLAYSSEQMEDAQHHLDRMFESLAIDQEAA